MDGILLAISNEGVILYTSSGETYGDKEVRIPYYLFSKRELGDFTDLQLYEYENRQSVSIGKINSSDDIKEYDNFYVRIVSEDETLDIMT